MADDAYIDLRVVHNILSGYGPVFNVGERVEAYTNPLWVGILTLWGWTGLSLPYGAVILGLCFSVVGLLAAEVASLQLWRSFTGRLAIDDDVRKPNPSTLSIPVGAVAFIAVPAVWDFATSGLETGLIFGWLGLSYWLVVRRLAGKSGEGSTSLRSLLPPAVIIGIGPLIRPDLALWSGCFLVVVLWAYIISRRHQDEQSWPGIVGIVIAAALLPLAYELFRMAYFAALLPNTAYAKDAGGAYWSQGIKYLWDFISIYDLYIPVILFLLLISWSFKRLVRLDRENRLLTAVWLAPLVGGLLDTFYVVRVGGDFMHARFLLPAFFGCLMPVMIVPIPIPHIRRSELRNALSDSAVGRSTVVALLILAWAIGCAGWLRPSYGAIPAKDGISNERAFYAHAAENGHPITPNDYAKLPFAEDGVWIHSLVEAQLRQQREASTKSSITQKDGRAGLVLINGIEPKQVTMSSSIPPSVVLVAVRSALGLVSYIAGPRAFIVDRFGLADPVGSRLDVRVRGRPGHERDLSNAWALARFADPASPAAQTNQVRAAEAALVCGAPKELLQAIHQPLTVHRMLENIRIAVRIRDLTIPENPVQAEAKFCGVK